LRVTWRDSANLKDVSSLTKPDGGAQPDWAPLPDGAARGAPKEDCHYCSGAGVIADSQGERPCPCTNK